MNDVMILNTKKVKNQLSIKYFVRYIVWAFYMFPMFFYAVFKRVPGLSLSASRILFLGVMAMAMVLGCICNGRFPAKNKEYGTLSAALFGYAAYTVAAYWNLSQLRLMFVSAIIIITIIAVMHRRLSGKSHVYSAVIAFSFFVLLCVCVSVCFNTGFMSSAPEYRGGDGISEEQQEEMRNTIRVLDDLSIQEKLNTLQLITNRECHTLGVVEIPVVRCGTLTEGCTGAFNIAKNEITLDEVYLAHGTSEELLTTVLHETRHAYQEQVIDLYRSLPEKAQALDLFHDAFDLDISRLAYESDFYTSDPDKGYYDQLCEVDARQFAEEASAFWLAWADYESSIQMD